MANPFFRNPQVRYPGCINQVPPSDERNTYQSLNMLGIESINRSDFPLLITNSVSGDVLVFDGTEWINQNWIPLPFGFGQAPTADHTLLVSGGLLVGASAEIVGNTLLDANLTVAGTGTVGGFWGVGTAPAHRFHAIDGSVETWFDNVNDNPAGATGWHINRPGNSNIPHVINWYMDHNYLWGMGVDSATDSTSGDFVVVNDNFTLFNGGGGSDIFRFSPGNASAHGLKVVLGAPVGTPRNQPQFFTVQGNANLCPLGLLINSDNSGIDALRFTRTASGTHCVRLNFNDEWIFGNDIGFTNDSSLAWFSAAGGTRLYLSSTSLVTYGTFAVSGTSLFQGLLTAGALTANGLLTATANIVDTGTLAVTGTSLFQGLLTAGSVTTNGLLTATANILDTGTLAASGNVRFGSTLTTLGTTIASGDLALFGHTRFIGNVPSVAALSPGSGTSPPAPLLNADSSDTRGAITFGTGTAASGGPMVRVTYAAPYVGTPYVMLQGVDATISSSLGLTVANHTNAHFDIYFTGLPLSSQPNTTYSVYYHVLG